MRLDNLRLLDREGLYDLTIHADRITAIQPASPAEAPAKAGLDLNGALAFPGLINSHDHLDFNLFPPLANKIYNNYTEWGPDIHSNNRASIDPILRIPQPLRTQWGVYKNLLNGFTTVVNHGEHLDIPNSPISVFQDCYCLHSVGFEPHWKWKLNHPARTGRPFALHIGEGTDLAATREIDDLIRWNIFRRRLIGIHGVAMTERQAAFFHALVWCPASNFFLLDKTAAIDRLHAKVPVLFGTDSTLTSGWNAWDQIRMARDLHLLSDRELLATLTAAPAKAWNLNDRGSIAPGQTADLVIARPKPGRTNPTNSANLSTSNQSTNLEAFFTLDPQDLLLVLHEGHIRLFDDSLLKSITEQKLTTDDFQPTRPGGKYVIGDLPGLMQEIRRYLPDFHQTIG